MLELKVIDSYKNVREMLLEADLSSRAPIGMDTTNMRAIHGKALADFDKENIYQDVHYMIIDLYKYMQWKDADLGSAAITILTNIGEL